MSFSRANSGGWAVGDKLTSAQANILDTDHANSLDKTVAGDTISGTVQLASTGQINSHLGQIVGAASQGITASVASGIASGVVGGIQLSGGSTDWPTFSATRSRTLCLPSDIFWTAQALTPQGTTATCNATSSASANVGPNGGMVTAVANVGSSQVWSYLFPLRFLHNGATLSSATIYLLPVSHAALPVTMPAFAIYRFNVATQTRTALASGSGYAVDPTALVANYNVLHNWTFTANQNNVIDTSQFQYFLYVWDEGGTNALGGSWYSGFEITYSAIPNMAFP